ncbi:MAG: sensor domain-containing diguanylate cyclase, partial [Rhodospirillales bacterium]|nr:sensor domain-containing diguanylate cyclase [Rhodospirillales bacterium]
MTDAAQPTSPYARLVDLFVPPNVLAENDPRMVQRFRGVLRTLFAFSVVIVLVLPLHAALRGGLMWGEILFSLLLFATPFGGGLIVRSTANITLGVAFSVLCAMVALTGFAFFTGGVRSIVLPWYVTIPAIAATYGDRRITVLSTGLSGLTASIIWYAGQADMLPLSVVPQGRVDIMLLVSVLAALALTGWSTYRMLTIRQKSKESLRAARLQAEESEKRLSESEARLRAILETSPAGVAIVSPEDGRILWSNSNSAAMFGMPLNEFIGTPVNTLWAEPDRHHIIVERFNRGQPIRDEEVELFRANGERWTALLSLDPIEFEGKPARLGWQYDITDQKRARDELERLATTDFLTGANNRRHLMALGEKEIGRARRYRHPVAVGILDADRFKAVNDTYGHEAGDQVLKALVSVCHEHLRDIDIFGRTGGEEFAFILPESTREGGRDVAERLRNALEATRVTVGDHIIRFTVSIGVTQMVDKDDTLTAMMKRADEA